MNRVASKTKKGKNAMNTNDLNVTMDNHKEQATLCPCSVSDVVRYKMQGRLKTGIVKAWDAASGNWVIYSKGRGGHHRVRPSNIVQNLSDRKRLIDICRKMQIANITF